MHRIHTVVEVCDSLGGFGREEFEGEDRLLGGLSLGELVFDVHGGDDVRSSEVQRSVLKSFLESSVEVGKFARDY